MTNDALQHMAAPRMLLAIVALLGACGVGIGAYAAHGLQTSLEKQNIDASLIAKRVAQAETGVRYHMYHTLAMLTLITTGYIQRNLSARIAAWLFILGILLFSGTLYLIAIVGLNLHWLVPIGGLAYIAGWVALATTALAQRTLSK